MSVAKICLKYRNFFLKTIVERWRCAYDYIEVFGGNGTSAPSVGKFCGYSPPQPMSSLGVLTFVFHTDYVITDKGWVADYQATGNDKYSLFITECKS